MAGRVFCRMVDQGMYTCEKGMRFPLLVQALRSLGVFMARTRKCTKQFSPNVVLYFNEIKYLISLYFQVFCMLFITEANTQGFSQYDEVWSSPC